MATRRKRNVKTSPDTLGKLSHALLNEIYIQESAPKQIPLPPLPMSPDDIGELTSYLSLLAKTIAVATNSAECYNCPDAFDCPDAFNLDSLNFTPQETRRLVFLRLYRAERFG